MNTTKRTMHHPEAFVGKRIDSTKWNIPSGYWQCEMTGKLFAEDDLLEYSFNHHFFNRAFLSQHGIYVETAAWLSEEGYHLIMAKLDSLGLLEAYQEAWEHEDDFLHGRCEISAAGLVWEAQPLSIVTSIVYSTAA